MDIKEAILRGEGVLCTVWDNCDHPADDGQYVVIAYHSDLGYVDFDGFSWDHATPIANKTTYVMEFEKALPILREHGYRFDGFGNLNGGKAGTIMACSFRLFGTTNTAIFPTYILEER